MTLDTKFKKHTLVVVAGIIEQINQHPMDTKTTTDYAEAANINRKKFQAVFRYLTGTGVQEYKHIQRMRLACQLLREEDKPIKEIAIICGYKSQRAFTTAFKNAFGMTPLEYQHHKF
jgi:AraC-like DNA-binding protein